VGEGGFANAKPGEGSLSANTGLSSETAASAERDPSSVADFVRATFSHKGRRKNR
jgi:hypothetical protein